MKSLIVFQSLVFFCLVASLPVMAARESLVERDQSLAASLNSSDKDFREPRLARRLIGFEYDGQALAKRGEKDSNNGEPLPQRHRPRPHPTPARPDHHSEPARRRPRPTLAPPVWHRPPKRKPTKTGKPGKPKPTESHKPSKPKPTESSPKPSKPKPTESDKPDKPKPTKTSEPVPEPPKTRDPDSKPTTILIPRPMPSVVTEPVPNPSATVSPMPVAPILPSIVPSGSPSNNIVSSGSVVSPPNGQPTLPSLAGPTQKTSGDKGSSLGAVVGAVVCVVALVGLFALVAYRRRERARHHHENVEANQEMDEAPRTAFRHESFMALVKDAAQGFYVPTAAGAGAEAAAGAAIPAAGSSTLTRQHSQNSQKSSPSLNYLDTASGSPSSPPHAHVSPRA